MENKNLIGNTEEGFKAKVFAMREKVTIDKKNLMIGDWVKDPIDNEIVWQWESCNYEDIEVDVLPIPITPEILEANEFYFGRTSKEEDLASATGFPLDYEPRWCYDDGDVEITISFPNKNDGGMVTVDNLRDKFMQFLFEETIFVHEFQHALRLCGLNEMADGFKVE